MKTNLAILLVLGFALAATFGRAQAADPSAGGEAGDVTVPKGNIDGVLRALADLADINIDIDPKILDNGKDATGAPNPPRQIQVNYTKILPMNAFLGTLENNDLVLVTNKTTGIYRVTVKDPKALVPLKTEVFQLKYSTTNVVPIVQGMIDPTRSKVLPNERASQVIVIATETELAAVRDLIEKIDTVPKQILIEAKLIETSMNPSSIRGFDWTGTLAAQNFGWGNGNTTGTSTTGIPGPTTTTTTVLPGGGTVTSSSTAPQVKATTLTTVLGAAGLTANTFNGFNPALGILNADGVRGVLSFMNQNSESEVIATPSAVTLDNQQARLEVTRAFPVFTQNPGSAQVAATTTLSYTNVGTILIVTPRVTGNSNISLILSPEVSNIDGQNSQTINGQVNLANVYASRRITTQVLIPSGNTLVMGGLVSDTTTKANSKVPILGDTPGLGYLFRRDSRSRTKQNLIIFVTPTIVQDFDFQYSPSQYLRQTPSIEAKPDEGPWNSGKPAQWGRSKK